MRSLVTSNFTCEEVARSGCASWLFFGRHGIFRPTQVFLFIFMLRKNPTTRAIICQHNSKEAWIAP